MTDQKLTALFTSNPVSIDPGDLGYLVENTGATPASGAYKLSQLMFNRYKITPSVASNNLTVALRHEDGTDPSTDRPLYFKIGNSLRAITAAKSVTKNAATNWCNAGSSELATKEVDYFVYIGYNATDGVTIGFSRIPSASLYSEFSATTTNEKYCAISTITNAAAGDDYVNIGRFAATLSAGAGYTWTVPTYTTSNLIQRPIYVTRWLSYTPTFVGFTGAVTNTVRYMVRDNMGVSLNGIEIAGTSNDTSLTLTLPFLSLYLAHNPLGAYRDNGTYNNNGGTIKLTNASATATLHKSGGLTSNWTNVNGKSAYFQLFYEI